MFICGRLFPQKILCDSEQANQQPKKFYDESGKIKIIDERNYYQTRARSIEQRIRKIFAVEFAGLEQNICENDNADADCADQIIPSVFH